MPGLVKLLRENKGWLAFLATLLLVRGFLFDYNVVPSGSMHPNILEGDYVLVDETAFDITVPFLHTKLATTGDPQRGDVVTFRAPFEGTRLIKRVIALPGDVISMHDKKLVVNGKEADYQPMGTVTAFDPLPANILTETSAGHSHYIQWLEGAHTAPDLVEVTVPEGYYLVLGDNRDNSEDSRFIGFIARDLLIGKATRILVSTAQDGEGHFMPGRFGRKL